MTYDERMEEMRVEMNAFKDNPAYRPYLAPGKKVFMVTYDIYTDPKYHEPDVRRWGIYYGAYRPDDDHVRLQHGKGILSKHFDSPAEAQAHLDRHAELKGWPVIERPKETT